MPGLVCLIFLFLWSVTSISQEGELEGQVISEVEVRSSTGALLEEVIPLAGLKKGDIYSARAVRQGIAVLYKSGDFLNIVVEAQGVPDGLRLTYTLVEKMTIGTVQISGNRSFPDKHLLGVMGVGTGEEFTRPLWGTALDNLRSFYQREGYFRSRVDSEVLPSQERRKVNVRVRVQEGERARIRKIQFTGERAIPDFFLYLSSRLPVEPEVEPIVEYSADLVRQAIGRLEELYLARGFLTAMIGPPRVEYQGESNRVEVFIPIHAGTPVRILFEGGRAFPRRILEEQLLIRVERSYADPVLEESARRLGDFLKKEGYLFAEVSFQKRDRGDRVEVLFKIEEGPQVSLSSLRFEGNRHLSTKELTAVMKIKEKRLFQKGTVTDQGLEADIREIIALYAKRGFLNTQIERLVTFSPDRSQMDLVLIVDEGVQTFIGRIEFVGNRLVTSEELLATTTLREGMPYHAGQIRADRFSVLGFYSSKGFIFVDIDQQTIFTEEKKKVVLRYVIAEGEPVRFGEIKISGNGRTKEYVIRRELVIHPDEPFDYEKLLQSQQRLYRLGYFQEVHLDPMNPDERESRKDLSLSVRERRAGAIEVGFGFVDDEGFRGTLEISHKNLFGTGRRISLRGELSELEKRSVLTFIEPWVFSFPLDARLNTHYEEVSRTGFDRRTTGITLGVEKSFSRMKASLLYQFERSRFFDVRIPFGDLPPEERNRVNIASLNPSLFFDTRDDPLNPRFGSFHGVSLRDAAKILGSEVQLVKVSFWSSWVFPLFSRGLVALSARHGFVERFGETEAIPFSERFFVGGRSTIRGYGQDSVGVPGKTLIGGTPTGGNVMILGNVEFRFTFFKNLGFVLFGDGGNVWPSFSDVSLSDMRYGVGGGLRYNTPVGPLRLDLGYKVDRQAGESPSEVHFTLGQAF